MNGSFGYILRYRIDYNEQRILFTIQIFKIKNKSRNYVELYLENGSIPTIRCHYNDT